MEFQNYLDEFATDWRLDGRAGSTADLYVMYLTSLHQFAVGDVTMQTTKRWLTESSSAQTARMRGRSVRAFGKWAATHDGPDWSWWPKIPLSAVAVTPQATATVEEYERASRTAGSVRDRLVVELLWCTGLRVSELARLSKQDVALAEGYVIVERSKTGKPRVAPLSDRACRLVRRLPQRDDKRTLLGMSSGAIQQLLRRLAAPSPHAWRRGWAVEALRSGVSETSLKAAAGWSSGAMVARYTSAVSGELAIVEFQRARHSQIVGG